MRITDLVGQAVANEIRTADRAQERGDTNEFPALTTRVRIEHTDPAVEVEARHLDRASEISVVADDQGRLEGSSVCEIDKIDREADIRSLLAMHLDLDRSTAKVGWTRHEAAASRLDERSQVDLTSSHRPKGAEMGMLRRRQSGIEPTIEERCVEMHTVHAENPGRQDGTRHRPEVDPVTAEEAAGAVHEIEPVDEHMRAEARHEVPSFPCAC
jgi:hypothetical protein